MSDRLIGADHLQWQWQARAQELAHALAALLVALPYREPHDEWLKRRSAALEEARLCVTDAEMERAEKLWLTDADFEDLAKEDTDD